MSMLRSTPNTFTAEESAGSRPPADRSHAMRQLSRYMASSSAWHRARSACTQGRSIMRDPSVVNEFCRPGRHFLRTAGLRTRSRRPGRRARG